MQSVNDLRQLLIDTWAGVYQNVIDDTSSNTFQTVASLPALLQLIRQYNMMQCESLMITSLAHSETLNFNITQPDIERVQALADISRSALLS